jgi:drug/metabolite transporter (DMT)-like permease
MSKTVSAIEIESRERSPMMRTLIRFEVLIGLGSFIIIALLPLEEEVRTRGIGSPGILVKAALLICLGIVATVGFYYLLNKSESFIDANSVAQAQFLDSIDSKNVNVAILVSAALSLFLELAIIRWQSSVFEFFCFL